VIGMSPAFVASTIRVDLTAALIAFGFVFVTFRQSLGMATWRYAIVSAVAFSVVVELLIAPRVVSLHMRHRQLQQMGAERAGQ
jgi:hypothetical protein